MCWETKLGRVSVRVCCWTVRDVTVANLCGIKCNCISFTTSPVAIWGKKYRRTGTEGSPGTLYCGQESEILYCQCRLAEGLGLRGYDVSSLCKYVWTPQTFRKIVTPLSSGSGSVKCVSVKDCLTVHMVTLHSSECPVTAHPAIWRLLS